MVKVGIIGLSEANGHPFSFSAIINGYNEAEFSKTEWTGILNYLNRKHESEIAALDAKVTHIWTQYPELSLQLSKSCYIECIVDDYVDMIGNVDAIVIARDDYSNHLEMSRPFLEKGIPVFIDKPLTLDLEELKWFFPYIESGLLMTCSGFRFAQELDCPRNDLKSFGNIKLIAATVINGWEKYGIHMVDALLGVSQFRPIAVECNTSLGHDSMLIELHDGTYFQVDALGPEVVTFSFDIYGSSGCGKYEIRDNFSAFKRCLFNFIKQVKSGKPSIDPQSVELSILTLIAGRKSKELGRKVYLDDLKENIKKL
jgi:hypothetical protein